MNFNNIGVQKYPLSQLFDASYGMRSPYEIPKYQREYVWGKENWQKLFDDLLENDMGYYMGTVIAINISQDVFNPVLEVIDGQQRLTTFSILLTSLQSVLSEYSELAFEKPLSTT